MRPTGKNLGFTLIELSIVLVIIGLIVGGILVGQDLIKSAEVRAQITQIEKYNQAVNTFRGKFGGLPGDLASGIASQFGFTLGAGCNGNGAGSRNGDGLIDPSSAPWTLVQDQGEVNLFWQDLSSPVAGGLIDTTIPNNGASGVTCNTHAPTWTTTPGTTYLGDYYPVATIGHGNFIYVYETSGFNWYGISALTQVNSSGGVFANTTIPVVQAYRIDSKIDDGLPTTGAVVATYDSPANWGLATPTNAPNAASDTSTTCYNSTSYVYSLSTYASYGAGGNCALSFRFQ